ncbi:hypothetical protein EF912_16145, partial [Streptomyces sp. WAC07061]
RFGPVPQGRSFVASLRDGLRPPLTDRPEPESRKTAGKPPKKRDGSEEGGRVPQRCARGRAPARPTYGPHIRHSGQGRDYPHERLIRAPSRPPRRDRSLRAPPVSASDDRLWPIPAPEDEQSSPGTRQARQIATRSSDLGGRPPSWAGPGRVRCW